ncbi:hypothetical protein M1555_01875 [Patescibacteria group bacterium]|nr:hypothetical protein [Patescibacteria group bacterium]
MNENGLLLGTVVLSEFDALKVLADLDPSVLHTHTLPEQTFRWVPPEGTSVETIAGSLYEFLGTERDLDALSQELALHGLPPLALSDENVMPGDIPEGWSGLGGNRFDWN